MGSTGRQEHGTRQRASKSLPFRGDVWETGGTKTEKDCIWSNDHRLENGPVALRGLQPKSVE